MAKFKYVLTFPNGDKFDSLEEYGDDDYEGTFSSESDAEEAAWDAIGCYELGGEILSMSNPGDYPYDEDENDDIGYEIVEI